MVRRSSVEECLICSEAPCVCGKPKAAPKKTKPAPVEQAQPASEPEPEPVVLRKPRTSLLHLIKNEAEAAPTNELPRIEPRRKPKPVRHAEAGESRTEEEVMFSAAIKAMGPLLHPAEKEKYKMILDSGPITLAEKKTLWKASRKEG